MEKMHFFDWLLLISAGKAVTSFHYEICSLKNSNNSKSKHNNFQFAFLCL